MRFTTPWCVTLRDNTPYDLFTIQIGLLYQLSTINYLTQLSSNYHRCNIIMTVVFIGKIN